jgi:hypothetical protein
MQVGGNARPGCMGTGIKPPCRPHASASDPHAPPEISAKEPGIPRGREGVRSSSSCARIREQG